MNKSVILTHPEYGELKLCDKPMIGSQMVMCCMELWQNSDELKKYPFPMVSIDQDAGYYYFVDGWKPKMESIKNMHTMGFKIDGEIKIDYICLVGLYKKDYGSIDGAYFEIDGKEYFPKELKRNDFCDNEGYNGNRTFDVISPMPEKSIIVKNKFSKKELNFFDFYHFLDGIESLRPKIYALPLIYSNG